MFLGEPLHRNREVRQAGMAQVFFQDHEGSFSPLALEADRYRVASTRDEGAEGIAAKLVLSPERGGRPARRGAMLGRAEAEPGETRDASWLIFAGADTLLRVNGERRTLGVTALHHRDEVQLDAAPPFYFSTERLARVEIHAGDELNCPRCAQAIVPTDPCVACPGCGVRHHQRDDRACWTHTPSCVLCGHTTDLDAGLQWSPEEL